MDEILSKYSKNEQTVTNQPTNIIKDLDCKKGYTKEENFRDQTVKVHTSITRKVGKWSTVGDDNTNEEETETDHTHIAQAEQKSQSTNDHDNFTSSSSESREEDNKQFIKHGEDNWENFLKKMNQENEEEINPSNHSIELLDPLQKYYQSKGKDNVQPDDAFIGPKNRFDIKPGRWWDGIDRSNGFEKRRFQVIEEKNASTQKYYVDKISEL